MVFINKKIVFVFHAFLLCFHFSLQASLFKEEELKKDFTRKTSDLLGTLSNFTNKFPGNGSQNKAAYLTQGLTLLKDCCKTRDLDPKNYYEVYDESLAEENWPEEERGCLIEIHTLASNGMYATHKDQIQKLESQILESQQNSERSYCPYQFSTHAEPSLFFLVAATNQAIKDLSKMEKVAQLARKAKILSDDFLITGIRLADFFNQCSLFLLKGLDLAQTKGERNWIRGKFSRSIIYSSDLSGYVTSKLHEYLETVLETTQEISPEEIEEGLKHYGLTPSE